MTSLDLSRLADLAFPPTDKVVTFSWKPLPHQIAPEWDWFLWILMGGRGTGKSDGGAHNLDKHMQGPPCDTRVPGGHRAAIIAPTLGDAAESCVLGPSGLKAHNPEIRMVTRKGGTYAIWPNGAEARIFGAFTPEDVERLRAGGNRSLLVGTRIATERGSVPIEQVVAGDRVYTSRGLRPVIKSWGHGKRPIWLVKTASGKELRLTPDHKVWVKGKWKRTDQLVVGDTLSSWNGAVTAGNDWDHTGPGQTKELSPLGPFFFIESFTSSITDQFHPVGTSITKTKTKTTTTRATSKLYLPPVTMLSMSEVLNGMQRAAEPSNEPLLSGLVNGAIPCSKRLLAGDSADALAMVSTPAALPSKCSHALCVELISKDVLSPSPLLAPDRVVTISPGNIEGETWDLCVAGEHEFIAEGLLVANCRVWAEELAAWKQLGKTWANMRFGLRIGPHPQIVATTTPKPRKALKRLMDSPTTAITHASTKDNPYLAQDVRDALYEEYGNTRLGQQELEGRYLDDVPGALASRDQLEECRVQEYPKLTKRVCMIDPSYTNTEHSDASGISVAGLAKNHVYLLTSLDLHVDVTEWAYTAVSMAVEWDCGVIGYESPGGSDANRAILDQALKQYNEDNGTRIYIPIEPVPAKLSKWDRAVPLQQAIQQGRFHLVGSHPKFEEEVTSWVPNSDDEEDQTASEKALNKSTASKSPNVLDSVVHNYRKLMGYGSGKGKSMGRQISAARIG